MVRTINTHPNPHRSSTIVGDDFNGRPTPTAAAGADVADTPAGSKNTGHTKTAQKILAVQKQPPAPTLFLGNLGFETTEDSIRELLDFHRAKDAPSADEKWIRKIRLGTFEDSGKCKGCVLTSANYYVSTTCPETPCARVLRGVSLSSRPA